MRRSSICKSMICILLLGVLFCGCGREKVSYLPEAENDTVVTVIGG